MGIALAFSSPGRARGLCHDRQQHPHGRRCLALEPDGRRGDVRPYFYVGDWGGDGHGRFVLRENLVGGVLQLGDASSGVNDGRLRRFGIPQASRRCGGCSTEPRPSTRTWLVRGLLRGPGEAFYNTPFVLPLLRSVVQKDKPWHPIVMSRAQETSWSTIDIRTAVAVWRLTRRPRSGGQHVPRRREID